MSLFDLMAFESFSEFIQMGKHGIHVWLSYGFFFITTAILLISLALETKKLEWELTREGLDK